MPPGLVLAHPLIAHFYAPTFLTEGLLRRTYSGCIPFPIALGSPLAQLLSAAIPPSAALCGKGSVGYLLFLIGLGNYTILLYGMSSYCEHFSLCGGQTNLTFIVEIVGYFLDKSPNSRKNRKECLIFLGNKIKW